MRRVNSVPLFIIGAGVVTFCLLIALALLDRASASRKAVEAAQGPALAPGGIARPGAPAVLSQAPAGIIEADPKGLPADTDRASPDAGRGLRSTAPVQSIALEPDKPAPVPAPSAPLLGRPLPDPALEQERALRVLEERLRAFAERARASSVAPFQMERTDPVAGPPAPGPREEVVARVRSLTQAAEAAAVPTLRSTESSTPPAASPAPRPAIPALMADTRDDSTASANRWHLDARWEAPRSAFELRAGAVIPALVLTGIRSELPGQVMAQVTADVYDTATGRHLLIPQGTRIIGRYAADVMYGQQTLFVAWQRLVRPDGLALDIGAMPGGQANGTTGLGDEVDNHYLRLFGSALLLSGVTAGVTQATTSATPSQPTSPRPSAHESVSEALGQQFGQVTAQLLVKNMNVSPTLEIRPGFRFVVLVTRDIDFATAYDHHAPMSRRRP